VTDEQTTTLRGVKLTKSFGDGSGRTTPLKEMSINLHSGELAVLMGPSGSGKSTFLAILSGLLQPDAGEVRVTDGGTEKSIWSMTQREREDYRLRNVGFIFQGYNLFPSLTARQQLEIVLRWGTGETAREARRRSTQILEVLGMGQNGHKMPTQLSGGEKQRVAIGRALIKNPKFIFADEPTSALDWKYGEQVIELLRAAAHEQGSTILVVSHDERIKDYVDVTYHILDGRLVRDGVDAGAGSARVLT